jgi:hypothetical protein
VKKVITFGEILVEIMATEAGDGFLEPIPLIGPFASGASASPSSRSARPSPLRIAKRSTASITSLPPSTASPPALLESMEAAMTANPVHWRKHLHGTPADLRRARHFGYSDRIRYYLPEPSAQAAVDRLLARLHGRPIPGPLVSQYLGALCPEVASGRVPPHAEDLVIAAIQRVLRQYADPVKPSAGAPVRRPLERDV